MVVWDRFGTTGVLGAITVEVLLTVVGGAEAVSAGSGAATGAADEGAGVSLSSTSIASDAPLTVAEGALSPFELVATCAVVCGPEGAGGALCEDAADTAAVEAGSGALICSLLSEYANKRSPYRCISSTGMASLKSFKSRNCNSS